MSTPYATGAPDLWQSRLGWPIPSAYPYEKFPPVSGFTGHHPAPDRDQMDQWMETHADSNLLLRVRPTVIGIDVDNYGDKQGIRTAVEIGRIHNHLYWGPYSTARGADQNSGIYFFRLHPHMEHDKLRDPGEHVEVIRHTHRYAVVAPSWHGGAQANYEWHPEMPHYDDLPWLSNDWYVHMTRGCACFEAERAFSARMLRRYKDENRKATDALADLEQQAEDLSTTTAGSRNERLSRIAGRTMLHDVAINDVLTPQQVTATLTEAALEAGLEPEETRRTIESAFRYAERKTTE